MIELKDTRSTTTRRSLLGAATVGVGAVIGGVIAVPVAGYALASAGTESAFQPVALGPVEGFTGEQKFDPTAAPYVEDPAQPLVSGGLAYVHYTGRPSHDWLAPDAKFVVFSNRCTHVGCPAQSTPGGFSCPCHGSQFDTQGARTAGPAVRPLDRFGWEIRADGNLWITQRWSVLIHDGRIQYFPVKSPGQPLTGQLPRASADLVYPAVTYRHGPPPKAR
jgi:Rieske Fe-S protein